MLPSNLRQMMKLHSFKLLLLFVIAATTVISINYSLTSERNAAPTIISNPSNKISPKLDENFILDVIESLAKKQDETLNLVKNLKEKKPDEKASNQTKKVPKYPDFVKCRNKNLKEWIPGSPKNMSVYNQIAPESSHSYEYLRAMVFYFPVEKASNFEIEFRWFYRSWIEMQKTEPKKWRTDLVVLIENDPIFFKDNNSFLNRLNCSFQNKRNSKHQMPMCTLIHYLALKNRITKGEPKSVKDILYSDVDIYSDEPDNLASFYSIAKNHLKNYPPVDSILVGFDGYAYLKSAGFDFIMRSDMDVFLTPMFAKWLPDNCNDFYVGNGGYTTEFNNGRLGRVAKELGIENGKGDNLGSTWFSTPEQIRLVSYYTVLFMAYMQKHEFSQPEREGKIGTDLWPDWHYGVLSMYGAHLALNHFIGLEKFNVVKLGELIDYPSGNTADVNTKLQIHVFHGDDLFSKFAFKLGHYDNMTVNQVDMDKVKFYCLKLAVEAKMKSCDDLKRQFDQVILNKI